MKIKSNTKAQGTETIIFYRLLLQTLILFPTTISGSDELCFLCESLNATHRTYRHLWRNIGYVQKHMLIYFQIKNIKLGKCNNHSNLAQKRWGAKNATSLLEEEAPPSSSEEKLSSEYTYETL